MTPILQLLLIQTNSWLTVVYRSLFSFLFWIVMVVYFNFRRFLMHLEILPFYAWIVIAYIRMLNEKWYVSKRMVMVLVLYLRPEIFSPKHLPHRKQHLNINRCKFIWWKFIYQGSKRPKSSMPKIPFSWWSQTKLLYTFIHFPTSNSFQKCILVWDAWLISRTAIFMKWRKVAWKIINKWFWQ